MSAGRSGRRPRRIELHQKVRAARRDRSNSSAPSCASRSRPASRSAIRQGGVRQGLGLPGRRSCRTGMRAVSLDDFAPRTAPAASSCPNDHVDVVLTRRDKAAEKLTGVEKFISETILRNVRVLAIDQTVEEKDGQKVVVGKTATLELDPATGRDARRCRVSSARCRWRCAAWSIRNRRRRRRRRRTTGAAP